MFCPKCGTQNPETGRFCRSCGTDLGNVSDALTGIPVDDRRSRRDFARKAAKFRAPSDVLASGIREIVVGLGFLIAAFVLLITNAANGHTWWWALLFPGFGALGRGISNVVSYQMNKRSQNTQQQWNQPAISQTPLAASLPPPQTEFVSPDSSYKTGDLVPPSVTDTTTKHLEMNSEGETMTLPKQP